MFVICVEGILYLLLYNLHDCTFNEDLSEISQWEYQWKRSFKAGVSIQAQEDIFSCKENTSNHPVVFF